MPELPEVETIARGLAKAVVGKTIATVDILRPDLVGSDPLQFAADLAGDRIAGVGRRGKFVVLSLTSRRRLVVHLRMTGRLIVRAAEATEHVPYTGVELRFVDGTRLAFADVRRFGRMRLIERGDVWPQLLGVEPLSDEFTFAHFSSLVAGRTTPIKSLLLDQRRIAGIGNIYACEALWEARVRPARAGRSLSKPARGRLRDAIRSVLSRAVELRGSSIDDYVDADGLRGGFQNVLSAYGRTGLPCAACGGPIVRTVLAQRGTWWCRRCQR